MQVPVAVHAVDPLAIRRQRRVVRERMGLYPALGCGLHLVAVGQQDHPVDRRPRRRDEAAAEALPPRFQRSKMLLRHALREARGRVASDLARQPRQHANGQHRGQLVPPPPGVAENRHLSQLLQQRRKRSLRRIHRLARNLPVRMRLLRREPGHRRAVQRVNVHLLALAMWVRVAASAARIARAETDGRPVRGSVHRHLTLRRIHRRPRQCQRMNVLRLPVIAQPTQHPADKVARRDSGTRRASEATAAACCRPQGAAEQTAANTSSR